MHCLPSSEWQFHIRPKSRPGYEIDTLVSLKVHRFSLSFVVTYEYKTSSTFLSYTGTQYKLEGAPLGGIFIIVDGSDLMVIDHSPCLLIAL